MSKKRTSKNMRKNIKTSIEGALEGKLQSILHDIEYRLDCLYQKSEQNLTGMAMKLGSRDLNLAKHQLYG